MPDSINIGPHAFKRALFIGPMEGITDIPFRRLLRKHGCDVICTQMIHAQALLYAADKQRVIETSMIDKDEHPIGFQLCGNDPEMVGKAAVIAKEKGADYIDLNMGCPAKNVVKNGGGSALLQQPELAARIVEAIQKHARLPATVKIRVGWTDDAKNHIEVGKKMEAAGAQLIAVHARTRAQRYKGKANWELTAQMKAHLNIPVIGNGDITEHAHISEKMKRHKLDGVMIARGTLGNPWIFNGHQPSIQDIYETMLAHLEDHTLFYGNDDRSYRTFRKHVVWYTAGLRGSATFRNQAFKERDTTKFIDLLHGYFKTLL